MISGRGARGSVFEPARSACVQAREPLSQGSKMPPNPLFREGPEGGISSRPSDMAARAFPPSEDPAPSRIPRHGLRWAHSPPGLTFAAEVRLLQERGRAGEARGGQVRPEEGSGKRPLWVSGKLGPGTGVYLQGFPISTHLLSTYCVPGAGGLQRGEPPCPTGHSQSGHAHASGNMKQNEGQPQRPGPRPVPLPKELEGFLEEVVLSRVLKAGSRAFQ